MAALMEEGALFIADYECNSPVASSDFGRLISGYRLIQTTVYRDTALLRPPYIGIPPSSDRLKRDTALLRPPYIGIPPYSDRIIGGTPPVIDKQKTPPRPFLVF